MLLLVRTFECEVEKRNRVGWLLASQNIQGRGDGGGGGGYPSFADH